VEGLKTTAKERFRRRYHGFWWAPRVRSVLNGSLLRRDAVDTSHLLAYREGWDSIGPVQRDEAFALFGLLRVLRPRTVVEFGFYDGRSAFNTLRALDVDARLYAYDVDDLAADIAAKVFADESRLTFLRKSQAEFAPEDVDGRPVDFVFLDASHEFPLNRATFRRSPPTPWWRSTTPGPSTARSSRTATSRRRPSPDTRSGSPRRSSSITPASERRSTGCATSTPSSPSCTCIRIACRGGV
jgi:hypothetical protein